MGPVLVIPSLFFFSISVFKARILLVLSGKPGKLRGARPRQQPLGSRPLFGKYC